MFGKGAIFLIMGFSTIFLVFGYNFGIVSTSATDNFVEYHEQSSAHQLALAGINMALNEFFIDKTWSAGIPQKDFAGGTVEVTVKTVGLDSKEIESTGIWGQDTKIVRVLLQPSSYAKFAWYVGNMSSKQFITGDTVWGPFHSQSGLNIAGDPVFQGKVTTLKGLSPGAQKMQSLGYDPKFYGGYETGIDIPLPVNYQFTKESAAAIDGVVNKGGSSYFSGTDLWLKFNSNGTVTYRTGSGSDISKYGPDTTKSITDFAPNGVIYLAKGNIYMSGVLDGKVTVVSGEASGLGQGNIYLQDDMVYSTDPMTWNGKTKKYDPDNSCDDMMGILATNNVIIQDNANNRNNLNVDGSIFCAQGGMQLENTSMPPAGSLNLRGGMIAAKEEILAQIDKNGSITSGYRKHVIFDQRFMLNLPPTFPGTGKYEIVSWYE